MSKKQHNSYFGYIQRLIDHRKVDPSPYQLRKHFNEDKLKELAASIQREGLIEPIVVRPKRGRYELIAGERRFRALRDYTEMKTIQAQIVVASELQARRISAAENLQREDLSAVETIEAVVEIVDAELIEDQEYASMGKNPADRGKTLLGKLDSVRRTQERGSSVSRQSKLLSNKFVGQVENIFANLPKPLEWLSFSNHDLPLLVDFCEDVQEVSIQHHPWPRPGLQSVGIRSLPAKYCDDHPMFHRCRAGAGIGPGLPYRLGGAWAAEVTWSMRLS